MVAKRSTKKPKRSAAERARLKAVRRHFQSARPSLEELINSGDYSQPKSQPELIEILELAAALQRARKERRLSLAAVARRAGIDKAALSRIENGKNLNPTIGTLETIAQALGAQLQFRIKFPTRSGPNKDRELRPIGLD
jgi:DNA-binding Xre family transcriptional regulator